MKNQKKKLSAFKSLEMPKTAMSAVKGGAGTRREFDPVGNYNFFGG